MPFGIRKKKQNNIKKSIFGSKPTFSNPNHWNISATRRGIDGIGHLWCGGVSHLHL